MPGAIVHLGSTVICAHGGQASPVAPFPRVMVSGQPLTTLSSPYVVAGCPFPPASGGPCVTAQWVMGATRVLAGGAPVVIQGGMAVCAPTGVPLTVLVVQPRVIAQ
jgi:hypothetical protein